MTLRKAIAREEGKKLTKKFNSQSELWRIEAVIHDGNWYDIEKWKKVAKKPVERHPKYFDALLADDATIEEIMNYTGPILWEDRKKK